MRVERGWQNEKNLFGGLHAAISAASFLPPQWAPPPRLISSGRTCCAHLEWKRPSPYWGTLFPRCVADLPLGFDDEHEAGGGYPLSWERTRNPESSSSFQRFFWLISPHPMALVGFAGAR